MALVKELLHEIEGSSKNGLKKFLKETGHTFEKGSGHILNGSGEKAAVEDLISAYNTHTTKNVVADAVEDVTSNEKSIENIVRENNKNNINNMSDKKFKFTRFNGKNGNVKNAKLTNPLSNEFMTEFAKNMDDKGINLNNISKSMTKVDATSKQVLSEMGKDSKFTNDIAKINSAEANLNKNKQMIRQATKNGNVTFEAGELSRDKKSKFQEKIDGALKKAIPVAVGGGLIFSMFNRGGQQSNSELYGQRQSYGGGGY